MKEAKRRNPADRLRHPAMGRAGLDRRRQVLLAGQRRLHRRLHQGREAVPRPRHQLLRLLERETVRRRVAQAVAEDARPARPGAGEDRGRRRDQPVDHRRQNGQDAASARAVQVIGTHIRNFQSRPAARSLGKPVWSNEDGPWSGNWSQCGPLPGWRRPTTATTSWAR